MDVTAPLQADLGVRIFLVHVRLARDADGNELIADGDSDRILVVAVQNDRISGRNFHLKHLQIIIVQGEMVVRLLVHGNDIRSLRIKWQRQKAHRAQPSSDESFISFLISGCHNLCWIGSPVNYSHKSLFDMDIQECQAFRLSARPDRNLGL